MGKIAVITGGRASDGPYGVDLLSREFGHKLLDVGEASIAAHIKMRDVLEHRAGFQIDKALRSIPKIVSADVLFCFLESNAIFPSILKQNGIPPFKNTPLVMISCWLAEELRHLPNSERREVVKKYSGVDLNFVFSENQVDILVESGFDRDRIETVNFGFSPELFQYEKNKSYSLLISSVGFDRGRDYKTLIEAVRGLPIELNLYTKPEILQELELPSNVIFHGQVPFVEYIDVLSASDIVAIPTFKLAYPTGQTVALEAAATGASLILTDSPAMRYYFDDDTACFVEEGNVQAWREAILELSSDLNACREMGERAANHVHGNMRYVDMWKKIDDAMKKRGWIS